MDRIGSIVGTSSHRLWNILVACLDHVESILGPLSDEFGTTFECGTISGTLVDHAWSTLGPSSQHVGSMFESFLETCGTQVEPFLEHVWTMFEHVWAIFGLFWDHV